ncbi:hypothetical protein ONE63_005161 [Megalurothrips usitatus]|uniref:C2H2-type domain-containing protein n=1 Tax=Megalurothrips usitatus TaxID=439358 RepID=A0AAV7XXR5_9NEOP|nr:hypothetical protein ONE63_005161 [Megalurothrips usitatus]
MLHAPPDSGGFIMSSEDLFGDDVPAILSGPSGGSTPVEASGVLAAAVPASTAAEPSAAKYVCPECGNTLKTKSGFTRHTVLHKINDYNSRKPMEEAILSSLDESFKNALLGIKDEPAVGAMGAQKRQCIEALSTCPSTDMLQKKINGSILNFVTVRTKVFPSAHHEAALKSLNGLLNDGSYCEEVKRMILLCLPNELKVTSDKVLNRLVWRLTVKFMEKFQQQVFHLMKKNHQTAHPKCTMEESESDVFKELVCNLLRAVFKFGAKSGNSTWALRCRSLLERFVVSTSEISADRFLDSKLWEEQVITIDINAFNLFLGIEKIIQSSQDKGLPCTADAIFESLTNPENLVLLDHTRELFRGILSEDLAIEFIRDLIKSLLALSSKLDAKRKLLSVKDKQKTSTVSLRTNLKRNPVVGQPSQSDLADPDDPVPVPRSRSRKNTQQSDTPTASAVAGNLVNAPRQTRSTTASVSKAHTSGRNKK